MEKLEMRVTETVTLVADQKSGSSLSGYCTSPSSYELKTIIHP